MFIHILDMPKSDKMPLFEASVDCEPDEIIPERRLLNACLSRAMQDASGNVSCPYFTKATKQREALFWLMDDSEEMWSFRWMCGEVSICPTIIRAVVRKALKEKKPIQIVGSRMPKIYKKTTTKRGKPYG